MTFYCHAARASPRWMTNVARAFAEKFYAADTDRFFQLTNRRAVSFVAITRRACACAHGYKRHT